MPMLAAAYAVLLREAAPLAESAAAERTYEVHSGAARLNTFTAIRLRRADVVIRHESVPCFPGAKQGGTAELFYFVPDRGAEFFYAQNSVRAIFL